MTDPKIRQTMADIERFSSTPIVPDTDEHLIAQGEDGSGSRRDPAKPDTQTQIALGVNMILNAIGEDVNREGLVETPNRVARFWKEFMFHDPGNIDVTFESIQTDQMVIVKDIDGWSLCEHHLLPFSFRAHVCYVTGKRVIGLSKIPRIVQKHAHKLQLQERLTQDIADELMAVSDALGVGVIIEGLHTCMQMRGVRSNGSMITSCLRGVLLANPSAKQEFMSLIGG